MDGLAKLTAGEPETWKAWLALLAPRLHQLVIERIGDGDKVEVDEFTGQILVTIVQTIHQISVEQTPAA
jgi:hypothetical protein